MALSLASVLHYWTARYGSIPVIGGKPTHARSSAGRWTDQQGVVQSAIVNTPRFNWATMDSERRQVMSLEPARTNEMLRSIDPSNAAWSKSNMSVTAGVDDPTGGTGAFTLTATLANGSTDQTLAVGASLVRTNSVWARRRTGAGLVKMMRPDGAAYDAFVPTNQWQRFTTSGAASVNRRHGINIVTNGDAIDVWNHQTEPGATASSDILTTSAAVTRAADSFYWDFVAVPQAFMAYLRLVETGGAVGTSQIILNIGESGNGRTIIYNDGGGGGYRVNVGGAASETGGQAAVVGEVVEIVAAVPASGIATIIMSRNLAAVAAASAASGIGLAWAGQKILLGQTGSGDFGELKVVKYADVVAGTSQGIMDELRAFELGPNGAVL